jgi:hypothetical protein
MQILSIIDIDAVPVQQPEKVNKRGLFCKSIVKDFEDFSLVVDPPRMHKFLVPNFGTKFSCEVKAIITSYPVFVEQSQKKL